MQSVVGCLIPFDYATVVATDNQQAWRPYSNNSVLAGKIWPAAA
jgi:hypothetical protein